MRRPLIAALLSALAWPGAGQFFNRDFKKGAALTFLTLLLGLSLFIGLGRELVRALPPNPSPFDPEQVRMVRDAMLQANPRLYGTYSFLLTLTWIFSVVDAWLGARERLEPPPSAPDDDAPRP